MRAVGARMLLSSSTPFIAYSSSLASDSAPGASTVSILKPDLRKTDVSSLVHHEALQRVSDRCRHRFSCVCVATWPRMCWCGQPMACTQVGPSVAPQRFSREKGHVSPLRRYGSTMTDTMTMMAAFVGEIWPGGADSHVIAPGPRWLRNCARTSLRVFYLLGRTPCCCSVLAQRPFCDGPAT